MIDFSFWCYRFSCNSKAVRILRLSPWHFTHSRWLWVLHHRGTDQEPHSFSSHFDSVDVAYNFSTSFLLRHTLTVAPVLIDSQWNVLLSIHNVRAAAEFLPQRGSNRAALLLPDYFNFSPVTFSRTTRSSDGGGAISRTSIRRNTSWRQRFSWWYWFSICVHCCHQCGETRGLVIWIEDTNDGCYLNLD